MKVTALGHEPSWSLIDLIQVSMYSNAISISFIAYTLWYFAGYIDVELKISLH